VSRAAIREAFLLLESKQLIEIKRGVKGCAFIKKQTEFLSPDQMNNMALDVISYTPNQVTEFRKDIETTVAALAATKADTSDISFLKSPVDCPLLHRQR